MNIFSGCENMYIHLKLQLKNPLWEGNSRRYSCDQCDYRSGCSLTNHMISIHEGVRYTCDNCDYRSGCSLTNHMKSLHEGVQFSICSVTSHFDLQYILPTKMK